MAALTVLGAIFVVGLAPHLDTDLWWHLRAGQYIALHHAVPTRDSFSFTAAGKPWTDYEWLAELMMYWLYAAAGLWGPILLFAAVITAAFSLVYVETATAGVNRLLAAFVVACGFGACSAVIGARIQMLTLLFLAAYASLLRLYRVRRETRILIAFPILMLLWANLHGGYPLGLALLLAWSLGEWLNRASGREGSLSSGELRSVLLTAGASAAVTALNPNGWRQLLFPFTLATPNAFTNHINEWVSPDFHMPQMMVFEALLLLLITIALTSRGRPDWTSLCVTLMATYLALSQGRNVAVWVVLVTPTLARGIQTWLRARTGDGTDPGGRPIAPATARPARSSERPALNLALIAIASLLFAVESAQFIGPVALARAERQSFPAGAMSYLRTHALPPHVFTSYAWGGYATWTLSGRYRDFIDGRANAVFDTRILYDYLDAYSAAPGWRGILRKRKVQVVVVEPRAPLAQVLTLSTSWRRVYSDPQAVVFVLRSASASA
ncbi:MAG TPA: hypothetical protein VKX16_11055 [Chloroflexota bacterium]|nr:hypothetical protein [Chloroflexota bacterium]